MRMVLLIIALPLAAQRTVKGWNTHGPIRRKSIVFYLICAESSSSLNNIKGKDPFAQNVLGAQTGQLNSMRSLDA